MDKEIGAFFDIDGTLYRNSLMIEHFKKLVKYEVIDPGLWHNEVKAKYKEWAKRQGDYEDYMLELVDIYIASLIGMKKSEIDFISHQVINLHGDIVYTYTRDRIAYHLDQGHKVIFISGSPEFLVKQMAKKYKIDDCIGAKYLLDEEGCFTGEVVPMWDSISKNKAIDSFVDIYNIDLSKSYAYGDTNGDFSMLSRVGNPTAINPTKELLVAINNDEAIKKNANIIVERKDVVYKLHSDVAIVEI